MNKKELCIATISWARNDEEEALLKSSLEKLTHIQIPVFIADGGSAKSFLDFIKSIPHFTLVHPSQKGVQAQANCSLAAAYKTATPFIFYTEPDKEDFFTTGLPKLLNAVTVSDKTGIVVAARSANGLQSFPAFQQMTEATINNCCAELVKQSFDFTYGPFLLKRELVNYLDSLRQDVGWGWRPYLFSIAHRLGLQVEAFIDDFRCPAGQQSDDKKERIYRMKQLEQNIRGLVLSAKAPL